MKTPIYITKITSKLAAEALSRARLQGITAFGETLTSSIGCSMHNVKSPAAIYHVTSPPIRRDPETPRLLIKSLAL